MLMKKPIRPSVSARVRPAMGVLDHHVVLAAPARQQHLEGGEQQHEQGGAVLARQGGEGFGAGGIDGEVMHGAAEAWHRRGAAGRSAASGRPGLPASCLVQ